MSINDQWPQLDHSRNSQLIDVAGDSTRRNSLIGQINNFVCQLKKITQCRGLLHGGKLHPKCGVGFDMQAMVFTYACRCDSRLPVFDETGRHW